MCIRDSSDTIVTGRSVGAPVRVLKNRMSREYVRQENAGADKMELEKYTVGSLRRADVYKRQGLGVFGLIQKAVRVLKADAVQVEVQLCAVECLSLIHIYAFGAYSIFLTQCLVYR